MCPHCNSKYSEVVKRRYGDGRFDFMCSACGRQLDEKSLTTEEILAAIAPSSNLTEILFGDLAGEKTPAAVIGRLYRRARTNFVDSVKLLLECGERLKAQKDTLDHGQWLVWLKAHEDELGFGDR